MKSLARLAVALSGLLAIGSSSTAGQTIPTSFSWTSTGPLISAKSDATHSMIAVKDPSAVRFNGQWILYASDVNSAGNYNIEFLHFTDWSQASAAQPYFMDNTPGFGGYHTAPQVFFFAPQNKWYLIFQSGQPQYSTNSDPTQPQNWTAPKNFFASPVHNGLDYWIICDSANCYLFFCDDNGVFYRSSTPIGNFPNGFSTPVIAFSDSKFSLFEAPNIYTVKGTGQYLANIECLGGPNGHRFFRAFTASRLDGPWTPLGNTLDFSTPFFGVDNVSFESGVSTWTNDFSSGGIIPSNDQTDTIDLANLQFLYQGVNPAKASVPYNQLPWQLGLATTSVGGANLIPNGTYVITSVHSGLAIDDPHSSTADGQDMQIFTTNNGANQQWQVNNLGNNVITLTNVASGQLLEVAGASKSAGAVVDQLPVDGQTNQQWNVISVGGGNFELTSVNSGLALDVIGGGIANGTKIDQWPYGGTTWQQWKFTSH